MKIFNTLLVAASITVLAACTKDFGEKAPSGDDTPVSFDFSTSQQVTLNVEYASLPHNTRVEVYTQNPLTVDALKDYVKDETLEPVIAGYTDSKGCLSLPVRLAAGDRKLYAYSPGLGVPVLLAAEVNGPVVTLGAADIAAPRTTASSRAIADTEVYWSKWSKQNFSFRACDAWSWNAEGRPSYLLDTPMQLDAETLNLIDAAIPKGKKFDLTSDQFEQIEISEDANVSLYFISNSSQRRNALAYFTYTNDVPTRNEINSTLTVLFPNLSSEALEAGEGVMLKYFDTTTDTWSDRIPAGTKIGFVLLVDAWQESGSPATASQAVYSHKNFNSYNIPSESSVMANRPHMTAFKAGEHFILSFEDLPYYENPNSKYNGDFSDDVFVMTANPIEALPEVPEVDGSVIPPYMTSYKDYGILAFEDNWPYKGDYDLNDVVVKYASELHISFDFDYNSIEETYTFLNNGGKYTNGFGIEYGFDLAALDLSKSSVKAVLPGGGTLDVPGFDEQLTKATLMLFTDAKNVPVGTEFRVTLVFQEPQLTWGFLLPPYNPFVTVNDMGGDRKEVHLTDHKPTPKADQLLFHTGHDLSGNGRYYISDSYYPFALDLSKAENYRMPTEKQRISEVYPRYDSWATSNGTKDKDWYLD